MPTKPNKGLGATSESCPAAGRNSRFLVSDLISAQKESTRRRHFVTDEEDELVDGGLACEEEDEEEESEEKTIDPAVELIAAFGECYFDSLNLFNLFYITFSPGCDVRFYRISISWHFIHYGFLPKICHSRLPPFAIHFQQLATQNPYLRP